MTPIGLMNELAKFLQDTLKDYSTQQTTGNLPILVYPGYPPIPDTAVEKNSYLYVLVVETNDEEDDSKMSTAKVEIGFSIYDADQTDGWRTIYNVMEHVRQALLKKRFIAMKHRLELPLKGVVPDEQPFPQWYGKLIATYTIGQPQEEGINYDDFQETKTTYGEYK